MTDTLNADLSQSAGADTQSMAWEASPSATVWRKRLDLFGDEQSRVTSVVRYDPKSNFPAHDHPLGEEILVLTGTFSDEHGDYPAGTFVLNPPGFRHAPRSRRGCTLFVKLRQYEGERRHHVVVDTTTAQWQPGPVPGVDVLPLYSHTAYPETIELLNISGGASLPAKAYPGGVEVFVIDGSFAYDGETFGKGAWLRLPAGSEFGARTKTACRLYMKQGHLAAAAQGRIVDARKNA